MNTDDVSRLEKFQPGSTLVLKFESAKTMRRDSGGPVEIDNNLPNTFSDLLELSNNLGIQLVAICMQEGKDFQSLIPSIFACEPPRRPRHEWNGRHKDNSRNHLKSPSQAKRRVTGHERCPITQEIHDQNLKNVSWTFEPEVSNEVLAPQVIIHCWNESNRPRTCGRLTSAMYIGLH